MGVEERHDLLQLRRELYETRLELAAIAKQTRTNVAGAVASYMFEAQTWVRQAGLGCRAAEVLENHLCDPAEDVLTLEDLQWIERAAIAEIKGFGPRGLQKLDAAMAERGFAYLEVV